MKQVKGNGAAVAVQFVSKPESSPDVEFILSADARVRVPGWLLVLVDG
jgi:hypothetical protein